MSDNSNITRDDLMAVGYTIYTALYDTLGKEQLNPAEFSANCNKAFDEFRGSSEK